MSSPANLPLPHRSASLEQMQQHVNVLGIAHLVFALLTLVPAVIVLFVSGGIWTIVHGLAEDPAASTAVGVTFGVIAAIVLAVLTLLAIPGLLAGWGLMQHQGWARVLTVVLSAFHLLNFPLGTALGAYGLWVLLSENGAAVFKARSAAN